MMKAKNPQWSNAAQTMIDCEIDHPAFGWIPFTASPEDVEAHGRELFARLSAGEFGPVAPAPAPAPAAPAQAPDFEDVPL